jgi:diguanylate cyclase (GGDEF)-like protein
MPLRDVGPEGPLWMTTVRDTTAQRAHERMLLDRAQSDPLTGILNSRAFREQLRQATALDQDTGPLSLALIDIDHFKRINDEHGHAIGDEVLCAVVDRLAAATEGAGVLARVGGEEFALLMPCTDAHSAHQVLGRALAALREQPLPGVGTVTASAGVAQRFGTMDDDALYRLADAYLYEAKRRGRDQVR